MSDTFYNFAAVWLLHVMKYEEKSHFEKGVGPAGLSRPDIGPGSGQPGTPRLLYPCLI